LGLPHRTLRHGTHEDLASADSSGSGRDRAGRREAAPVPQAALKIMRLIDEEEYDIRTLATELRRIRS